MLSNRLNWSNGKVTWIIFLTDAFIQKLTKYQCSGDKQFDHPIKPTPLNKRENQFTFIFANNTNFPPLIKQATSVSTP